MRAIDKMKLYAKRYQWLRRQKENLSACFANSEGGFGLFDVVDGISGEDLDKAIDALAAKWGEPFHTEADSDAPNI